MWKIFFFENFCKKKIIVRKIKKNTFMAKFKIVRENFKHIKCLMLN